MYYRFILVVAAAYDCLLERYILVLKKGQSPSQYDSIVFGKAHMMDFSFGSLCFGIVVYHSLGHDVVDIESFGSTRTGIPKDGIHGGFSSAQQVNKGLGC
jgi:hypothetical protein